MHRDIIHHAHRPERMTPGLVLVSLLLFVEACVGLWLVLGMAG